MGPLQNVIGMLPGMPKEVRNAEIDDREITRIEAIIHSMTPEERRKPDSSTARAGCGIAQGSGHDHRRRQQPAEAVQAGAADDEGLGGWRRQECKKGKKKGKDKSRRARTDRAESPGSAPGTAAWRLRCPRLIRRSAADRDSHRTPREEFRLAVKIRLMRVGKKKQPTYRVVVADARSPRDGRSSRSSASTRRARSRRSSTIDDERSLHWLRSGAQPTEQVGKLLEITGVWDAYKAEPQGRGRRRRRSRRSRSRSHAAPRRPRPPGQGRGRRRGEGCGGRRRRRTRRPPRQLRPTKQRVTRTTRPTTPDEETTSRSDDELRRRGRDRRRGQPRHRRPRQDRGRARRPLHRRRSRRGLRRLDERRDNVAILVHTSPGDLGRIIGKRGRVIQALRQVARAAGATEGVKVSVDVAE